MFQRPEVMVVPLLPSEGPMPPPKGRDAVAQRGVGLLRRDHVHVAVDARRGENQVLARDGVGRRARHQIGMHAVHYVGVARFADARYLAVLDAHVGFDHAQLGVDNGHVGYHQIERALLRGHGVGQSHSVAEGLAAAVDHFVAVLAQILLDLDVKVGVAQTYLVADGGAEQIVVFLS